jgi:hypothetical protein
MSDPRPRRAGRARRSVSADAGPVGPLDRAPLACMKNCAATTRWERRDLSPVAEAWLGTCTVCGRMTAFVPGQPDLKITDPLTLFLTGALGHAPSPARPAWQRFYMLTNESPIAFPWRFTADACDACGATVEVEGEVHSPRSLRTLWLCLNCGKVAVQTISWSTGSPPVHLHGGQWAPPDPAVKTLRKTILDAHRRWVDIQQSRPDTDEDD